ncbi:MAG: sulfatase-like hydrolase/transferase, partial [Chthoniobacterales bacterium]
MPDLPPPAHVIVIQADDLGIDDLGFSGNPLAHTPNLDRFATEAIQVLDFTVNPVCAPSRATLLTGRHFLLTGVSHVHGGKDFLHLNERTIADAMRSAGWRTGMWGKWHLGRGPRYDPWERGFEEAYAAELYDHKNTHGELNGEGVQFEKWGDDAIVDSALDFL